MEQREQRPLNLRVLRNTSHSLFVSPSRCSIDVHHSRRFIQHRQVLIHHLWEDRKNKNGREKRGFQHISPSWLVSAPPPCTHERCGGGARCQTPADVCEHWRLCNMGQQKSRRWWALRHERAPHYSHVPTDERHRWHAERCETKHVRKTWGTHQSPHHAVARRCATPCRHPSAASAASAALSTPAHQTPPRSSCLRRLENTWDLERNVACGVWICHQVGHVRRAAMSEKPVSW